MTTEKQQQAPSKVELAYVIAKDVQIVWVKLLSSSALQEPGLLDGPPPTLNLNSATTQQLDRKSKRVRVTARFECIGTCDSEKPVRLLHLDAMYELVYSLPSTEGIEDRHVTAFGELNGLYNGWPYWRELVQSTLGRMGLPPLTLPVYRPSNEERSRPALSAATKSASARLEGKIEGNPKSGKRKLKKG